jgi:hypothetical protein
MKLQCLGTQIFNGKLNNNVEGRTFGEVMNGGSHEPANKKIVIRYANRQSSLNRCCIIYSLRLELLLISSSSSFEPLLIISLLTDV